jgi:RNA polymerase sigma factor (sigma-70 family)
VSSGFVKTRAAFDQLPGQLRPKLHGYCARMTGSVVDGEDVVQEAIVKAIEALPGLGSIEHPDGWLFRIAHNAALDFLRRRARQNATRSDEDPDMFMDPVSTTDDRQIAAASLHTFMRLPVAQRSSVILMDVLGYSLQEIAEVIDSTVPAGKPHSIAAAHGCVSSRWSAMIVPCPSCPQPSARCSRPMSTASMPAISRLSGTCSPARCGSNSSTRRA